MRKSLKKAREEGMLLGLRMRFHWDVIQRMEAYHKQHYADVEKLLKKTK